MVVAATFPAPWKSNGLIDRARISERLDAGTAFCEAALRERRAHRFIGLREEPLEPTKGLSPPYTLTLGIRLIRGLLSLFRVFLAISWTMF